MSNLLNGQYVMTKEVGNHTVAMHVWVDQWVVQVLDEQGIVEYSYETDNYDMALEEFDALVESYGELAF